MSTSIQLENGMLTKYGYSYEKCNDAVEGQEAVKLSRNAQKYLPPLSGHVTDVVFGKKLYNTYKMYAYYFPASGRTVDGYTGIAFRKNPSLEVNGKEELENDFTLDGQPLADFAKNVFEEVIINYRPVILVDYSEDAQRAYARMYKTLDVLDWRTGYINGVNEAIFIKLYETIEVTNPKDEFESIIVDQIRVLDIDDTGYYRSRVFQKASGDIEGISNGEYEQVGDDMYPTIRNEKLTSIPIIPVSPIGQKWDLDYSPINDLCDVAIAYYRISASYQNALLVTGNPTPCFKGLQADPNDDVTLGSSKALEFQVDGDAWFLTLGSDGVEALRKQLDSFKNDMAVVGARILSSDPSGVEAADTAQIHRAGEQSVLMSISKSASRAVDKALKLVYRWTYDENVDSVSFELNVDFDTSMIKPEVLAKLFELYSANAISYDTFFAALQKGEIYPEGTTLEDEKEKLDDIKEEKEEKQREIAGQGLEEDLEDEETIEEDK